jgi:hypothetical protein
VIVNLTTYLSGVQMGDRNSHLPQLYVSPVTAPGIKCIPLETKDIIDIYDS